MSEELDKIKPTGSELLIHGKKREIKFNFSAWAILEEEYGSVKNLSKMEKDLSEKPFKTVPHLIWIALQDKDGVTEETVLDEYGMDDIEMISEVLSKAIYGSLPSGNKKKATAQKV